MRVAEPLFLYLSWYACRGGGIETPPRGERAVKSRWRCATRGRDRRRRAASERWLALSTDNFEYPANERGPASEPCVCVCVYGSTGRARVCHEPSREHVPIAFLKRRRTASMAADSLSRPPSTPSLSRPRSAPRIADRTHHPDAHAHKGLEVEGSSNFSTPRPRTAGPQPRTSPFGSASRPKSAGSLRTRWDPGLGLVPSGPVRRLSLEGSPETVGRHKLPSSAARASHGQRPSSAPLQVQSPVARQRGCTATAGIAAADAAAGSDTQLEVYLPTTPSTFSTARGLLDK